MELSWQPQRRIHAELVAVGKKPYLLILTSNGNHLEATWKK